MHNTLTVSLHIHNFNEQNSVVLSIKYCQYFCLAFLSTIDFGVYAVGISVC